MSAPPPRPAVMDPLHITEFASDRYFTKLTQEREQAQRQQQQPPQQQDGSLAVAGPSVATPTVPVSTSSKFILPIRETKAEETEQKQKKSRFGGFSRLLHSKPQPTPASSTSAIPVQTGPIEVYEPRKQSIGEVYVKPRSVPFDELFLGLPTELQIQVIASLPLSDVLNLRLASRAWHSMVTMHEAPIVRYHLDHQIPAYAKRLYPPDIANLNFHYLCGLWHRLHVASKISFFISEWVTKEIFLRNTEAQRAEFAPQKERMRRRLIPLLFTIFHFFETYRKKHVEYLVKNNGRGLQQTPYTLNPIELEIMDAYDDKTLLQVHQVFPLVVASFCRRLRPPSYVGRVERSLRGYLREKPADEVHVAALLIGGLRQVERFWEIKGYNTRRAAVDVWYNGIIKEPVDPNAKKSRGLMGIGRKKSSTALRDAATATSDNPVPPVPPLPTSVLPLHLKPLPPLPGRTSVESGPEWRTYSIFNTSLSKGMPMGPLSREHLRLLVPDLPILQKLWLNTAEALILDKKIVERASDIRRNAAVMMELIREDGVAEEDEWWYGQGEHASVRPPLDSIDEDPEEAPMP